MRSLILIASIILSYTLLRGWPSHWHPIIRTCLAVSTLVAAFGLWGHTKHPQTKAATPSRPPRLLDYLSVGITILLIECLFLILLSFAPLKSEHLALKLDQSLHPTTYQTTPATPPEPNNPSQQTNSENSRSTSNWLFSGPGPRTLNKNEKVNPSNRPELYLFPASLKDASQLLSTELYLRNFTLASYNNGTWFPKATIPRTLKATNSTITIQHSKPGPSATYDISHPANPSGQTLAVTIPDLHTITTPSLREISPDTYRLPSSLIKKNNYRYQVTSTPFQFKHIKKEKLTPAPSPAPEYLTLPTDPILRKKIQTLATTLGPPSRSSLSKLRHLLHTRYRYSLNLNMPPDADPISTFLFQTHTGYCTHFATATAMLTRAMGIPSRIAFGWSGGRYFSSPNLFVFRAREAHAWTEIFLKDLGWVIFETTPPTRQEGASSLATPNEEPPLIHLSDDPEKEPTHNLLPLKKIASWIALTSALLLLVLLLLRRSTTPLSSSSSSSTLTILPTPPHYLTAFRRACHAHGHPMPRGRTLQHHLSLIQPPNFNEKLLTYHYDVHYGHAPKNKLTEKKLLKKIKAWEKSTLLPSVKKHPPLTE